MMHLISCNITQRWGLVMLYGSTIVNGETYISMLDIDTDKG